MNKIFYVVSLVLLIVGTTAATTILTIQPAQAQHHHCSLPNGNHFPGQGGVHSNPDSNGGGCPNGLTDDFGNGNN